MNGPDRRNGSSPAGGSGAALEQILAPTITWTVPGDNRIAENYRGLEQVLGIVRHLVMPGLLSETEAILRFIADELGPGTYVNVMAQYYPAGRTSEFPEIDRHLQRAEFARALELADDLGLRRLDARSRTALPRLAAAG